MFSCYVWDLYLKAGGNRLVQFFKNNLKEKFSQDYAREISDLHVVYCPDGRQRARIVEELGWLYHDLYGHDETEYEEAPLQEELVQEPVQSEPESEKELSDYFIQAFKFYFDRDSDCADFQDLFECFISSMAYTTTFLALLEPDLFIPYYFPCNFNVFQIIAKTFSIPLPNLPVKRDYEGRLRYYASLCWNLKKFRERYNMNPYALYAFLYDFAPKYIGGTKSYLIENLPEPKAAFFIGGAPNDPYYQLTEGTITPWQCNPETRAGDMLVMYITSPRSEINSIWRSICVGFIDPFFWYYRITYIGHPEIGKPIPLREIKEDKRLADLPLVRKNMQGINGVEIPPSIYNYLQQLTATPTPPIEYLAERDSPEICTEKDVEDLLVKPLLKKLGYDDAEYAQQYCLGIGNHNRLLIPDFVLLPESWPEHEKAFAVIEAKLKIKGQKTFFSAQKQVRSYAKQLNAKFSSVVSMDKVWVFSAKDDFEESIFEASWAEMQDNMDVFSALVKILGKS
ncbi:MAG: hypothetical protein SPK23_06380 [Eubacteriales bacterium]|nr:hypothetical protein [Clostridiales bacterium]MDY5836727.1 hypothetical protein [Eubacteriales bacterium]